MTGAQPVHQEIIIVRRGGGDDLAAPKGGSWKIAYADFVTAMMAFFLVMWLINSANEVTKAKVASYFNPIKMTDTTPSSRGLKEASETRSIPANDGKSASDTRKEPELDADQFEADVVQDAKLLADPQAAMDEIEKQHNEKSKKASQERTDNRGDPFDPMTWQASPVAENAGQTAPFDTSSPGDVGLRPTLTEEKPDESVAQLEQALQQVVARHQQELNVSLSIDRTAEGLLIKLSDNTGEGMFASGSARPEAALIALVSAIGTLLKEKNGQIIVRGHTDSRPYKRGSMDNWQLSTARAHMASYMLVRGGLPESRIKKIEGHGSAAPLLKNDPTAHANRRVEFLLVPPGGDE